MQQGSYRDRSLAYKKKRHRLSGIDARQSGGVKNGVRGNSLRAGFSFAAQVVDPSDITSIFRIAISRRFAATNNPESLVGTSSGREAASLKRPRNHKFGFGDGAPLMSAFHLIAAQWQMWPHFAEEPEGHFHTARETARRCPKRCLQFKCVELHEPRIARKVATPISEFPARH